MPDRTESESRKLLGRLREVMAESTAGQARLDAIVKLIAHSMGAEVCSIYLFRDTETLELCATEGLNPAAVHVTRMRLGEGLVGRVAKTGRVANSADAPSAPGFRYMPETGEEIYSSFLGVPIRRLGEKLGVLVVQSKAARSYSEDEVYAVEVVAMVLAEMTELGAFLSDNAAMAARHKNPAMFRGGIGQEGVAEGRVWLHEPRVVVTNPIAEDPEAEKVRLHEAIETLKVSVDDMLQCSVQGVVSAESRTAYLEVIARLIERGAEGVIAGCTEIELLVGPGDVDVPYFPTTALHAQAAARWALAGPDEA